jgi:hypothetical protein
MLQTSQSHNTMPHFKLYVNFDSLFAKNRKCRHTFRMMNQTTTLYYEKKSIKPAIAISKRQQKVLNEFQEY